MITWDVTQSGRKHKFLSLPQGLAPQETVDKIHYMSALNE